MKNSCSRLIETLRLHCQDKQCMELSALRLNKFLKLTFRKIKTLIVINFKKNLYFLNFSEFMPLSVVTF